MFKDSKMTLRDSQKAKTESKLLTAIDNIENGRVTNRELRKKRTVKLNISNVEKEAGLTSGALRHYPHVKVIINNKNSNVVNNLDKGQNITSHQSLDAYDKNKLKDQKKKLMKRLQQEKQDKAIVKHDYEALKLEKGLWLEHHHQVVAALFNLVHQEARQTIFDNLPLKSTNNIFDFPLK